MNRRASFSLMLLLAVSCSVWAEPLLKHSDVFVSGKDGYHTYRIPAIEAAADGSLAPNGFSGLKC